MGGRLPSLELLKRPTSDNRMRDKQICAQKFGNSFAAGVPITVRYRSALGPANANTFQSGAADWKLAVLKNRPPYVCGVTREESNDKAGSIGRHGRPSGPDLDTLLQDPGLASAIPSLAALWQM
jgi:hypothetical protein